MKISQSFREDSIVGRYDIICRDRMIHEKLMNITTNMKKSTILTKFFRRLGVWQSPLLLPKLSIPQKSGFEQTRLLLLELL